MSEIPESAATAKARQVLFEAVMEFDATQGQPRLLTRAIEGYVENKITDAIDEISNRIEEALGARP